MHSLHSSTFFSIVSLSKNLSFPEMIFANNSDCTSATGNLIKKKKIQKKKKKKKKFWIYSEPETVGVPMKIKFDTPGTNMYSYNETREGLSSTTSAFLISWSSISSKKE